MSALGSMYYPPFEGAIAAGVGSVMCSYNKIQAAEGAGSFGLAKTLIPFSATSRSDWVLTDGSCQIGAPRTV